MMEKQGVGASPDGDRALGPSAPEPAEAVSALSGDDPLRGELHCHRVYLVRDALNNEIIGMGASSELAAQSLFEKRTKLLIGSSVWGNTETGLRKQEEAAALHIVEASLSYELFGTN